MGHGDIPVACVMFRVFSTAVPPSTFARWSFLTDRFDVLGIPTERDKVVFTRQDKTRVFLLSFWPRQLDGRIRRCRRERQSPTCFAICATARRRPSTGAGQKSTDPFCSMPKLTLLLCHAGTNHVEIVHRVDSHIQRWLQPTACCVQGPSRRSRLTRRCTLS